MIMKLNNYKINNLDKNSIVLDVGSGTGRHCKLLKDLGCKCGNRQIWIYD